MKAIETHYAGHRFRSRLEAKWCVFFQHLSIRWEYEPQGFRFAGRSYLPDFLLPDIPPETRRRLLRRQNLDTAEEIIAESLADQLAAAIRGSAMHESRFLEIFG